MNAGGIIHATIKAALNQARNEDEKTFEEVYRTLIVPQINAGLQRISLMALVHCILKEEETVSTIEGVRTACVNLIVKMLEEGDLVGDPIDEAVLKAAKNYCQAEIMLQQAKDSLNDSNSKSS